MNREPDPRHDKLIKSFELYLKFNQPALNIKTGNMEMYSLLHYQADLYKREDESKYYIFTEKHDNTCLIMNCVENEYIEIEKQIELNDSIDIWQPSICGTYRMIPKSHRHTIGIGGLVINAS